MRPQSETKPILSQFLDQNKVSVVSLRDFKKTARELIEACRIKSNIHPLLADHTFREAERFLEIIDLFEANLKRNQS
jgi:fibrillarin-like rRNA methylase